MYKLKNKQLIHLTKGKHHDGSGLYIRITRQGKGLWTYRYRLNKTSHEMSLGTYPEVSLSEASGLKSQPGENLRSDYVHVNMLCFEIDY